MASLEGAPWLVVGLGNPGPQYAGTPHNLGFEVVDTLLQRWKGPRLGQKFQSEFAQTDWQGQRVLLLKPQTYMNLSGRAVGEASHFFKIAAEQVLVISDDLDLPTGALRLRLSGSSGGHNGLKSIIEVLGTQGFPRLRVGVGRSEHQGPKDYLLSKVPKRDRELYADAVVRAADAVETVLKVGVEKAMSSVNVRPQTPAS